MRLVQSNEWYEYLLYNPTRGFRRIIETGNGWETASELSNWPIRGKTNSVTLSGAPFTGIREYGSRVLYAVGAFTRRIEPNDVAYLADYANAKSKLTSERRTNELAWTRSYRVSPQDIALWFHRPELAKIQKKEPAGKWGYGLWDIQSLRPIAIFSSIALFLINLPAISTLGDGGSGKPIGLVVCGTFLLWLPWWMKR